jgi:hypothetical protein
VTGLIPAPSCRACRPHAPFSELVKLSPQSVAGDLREEHGLAYEVGEAARGQDLLYLDMCPLAPLAVATLWTLSCPAIELWL